MPGKVSAGTKRKDPPAKKAESSDDDDSSEEEVAVTKKPVPAKAQPAAKGKAAAKKVSIPVLRKLPLIVDLKSQLSLSDLTYLHT